MYEELEKHYTGGNKLAKYEENYCCRKALALYV
jgi:hypothetical protein